MEPLCSTRRRWPAKMPRSQGPRRHLVVSFVAPRGAAPRKFSPGRTARALRASHFASHSAVRRPDRLLQLEGAATGCSSKTNNATRDDAPTSLRNDRHSSLRFGTRASFRRPIAPLRARSKQTRVLFGWLHACELCRPRMANVERTHLEFMCDGGTREDRNADREKSASVAGRNYHIYCDDIAPPQRGADVARGILLRLGALHKVLCRDRCFLDHFQVRVCRSPAQVLDLVAISEWRVIPVERGTRPVDRPRRSLKFRRVRRLEFWQLDSRREPGNEMPSPLQA